MQVRDGPPLSLPFLHYIQRSAPAHLPRNIHLYSFMSNPKTREKSSAQTGARPRHRHRERERERLKPPFDPSMGSLCHPCITTIHLSDSFLSLKLPQPPCAVLMVRKYKTVSVRVKESKQSSNCLLKLGTFSFTPASKIRDSSSVRKLSTTLMLDKHASLLSAPLAAAVKIRSHCHCIGRICATKLRNEGNLYDSLKVSYYA